MLLIFVRSERSLCTSIEAPCQSRTVSVKAVSIETISRGYFMLRVGRVNLFGKSVRESMIANSQIFRGQVQLSKVVNNLHLLRS